jgi:hypothetical protein
MDVERLEMLREAHRPADGIVDPQRALPRDPFRERFQVDDRA